MKNYILGWVNGEDEAPAKVQVSARVEEDISDRLQDLADHFGIKKTAVIGAALDIGVAHLEEELRKMPAYMGGENNA